MDIQNNDFSICITSDDRYNNFYVHCHTSIKNNLIMFLSASHRCNNSVCFQFNEETCEIYLERLQKIKEIIIYDMSDPIIETLNKIFLTNKEKPKIEAIKIFSNFRNIPVTKKIKISLIELGKLHVNFESEDPQNLFDEGYNGLTHLEVIFSKSKFQPENVRKFDFLPINLDNLTIYFHGNEKRMQEKNKTCEFKLENLPPMLQQLHIYNYDFKLDQLIINSGLKIIVVDDKILWSCI